MNGHIDSRRELLKAAAVAVSAVAGRQPIFAQPRDLLAGFATRRVQTSGATIHVRTAGTGPPLLLLHGFPQTNVIWHKIAEPLSRRFTVVAPDLRGYGFSSKPPDGENHSGYSQRAMAMDQVEVIPEQLIEAAPETFLRRFLSRAGITSEAFAEYLRASRAWHHTWVVRRLSSDDPLRLWREVATDVRGRSLPGGHNLAEELPEQTLSAVLEFIVA
jgi:hypothetical protein